MELGEKIKSLRIERGLTLEAVGNIVGVGKSTVRKWENGDIKNMGRDKIELIAKALNVTPGYLMGWEEEPPADTPPHTAEARFISSGVDRMPPEDRKRAQELIELMFAKYYPTKEDNKK